MYASAYDVPTVSCTALHTHSILGRGLERPFLASKSRMEHGWHLWLLERPAAGTGYFLVPYSVPVLLCIHAMFVQTRAAMLTGNPIAARARSWTATGRNVNKASAS